MKRIRLLAAVVLAIGCWAASASAATPTLLYTITGESFGSSIGRAIASAGDVDGDGFADFIVGSPGYNYGGTHLLGYVEVYSGATGNRLFHIDGAVLDDNFGVSVAGVGDWNGDGRDDFCVGSSGASPGGRTNAGSVFVYSGRDGSLLARFDGPVANMCLGVSVAGPGDLDHDGHPDLVAGAPCASPAGRESAGSVIAFSGVTGGILWRKDGESPQGLLGWSVGAAGDVNRDGYPDVIAGGPGISDTNTGAVYVLSGGDGSTLYAKEGSVPGDGLGTSVAAAGDVDGDGWPDFMAGAPLASTNVYQRNGEALIWSGADGSLLRVLNGTSDDARFGTSVAGAGDVDGDGRPDVIVGAPAARGDYILYNFGVAYVFTGKTGSLIFSVGPDLQATQRGYGVAAAGDVNGDGRGDVLFGSPLYDVAVDPVNGYAIPKGRVEVYSLPGPVRPVAIDIKPAQCPNPLNVGSHGNVSVSVLGAPDFDVAAIDPATVRLSGSYAIRSATQVADTETPASSQCACPAIAPDGSPDRTFQFSIADLAWRLGTVHDGDTKTLRLSGALKDGTRFEGRDCVVIQANGKLAAALAAGAGSRLSIAGSNPVRRGEVATLSLRVPEGGAEVEVSVFSVTGRRVADLAHGFREAGVHSVRWDGRLSRGTPAPAGIYFARARVAGEDATARILILP